MPNTPNEALPYPAGTVGVPPDPRGDFQALATAADGKIHEVRGIANGASSSATTAQNSANSAEQSVAAATAVTTLGTWNVASGWTTNRISFYKIGRHVQVDVSVNRTGGTISTGSSGNITNTALGSISNAAFLPVVQYAALASGPGGSVTSGYMFNNGGAPTIYLAAYGGGGIDVTNGTEVTLSGVYLSAS